MANRISTANTAAWPAIDKASGSLILSTASAPRPSREARENIAIDAILQRLAPRAAREWACGRFSLDIVSSKPRAGWESVMPGDSAIEEADYACDLQTGGRYRRIGDLVVGKRPLRSKTKLPVPNVTVTAPAAPVEPPYLRSPGKSFERNPYAGRYRVEEDKFTQVPCAETRIASSAGGKCLQGYRLVPGLGLLHQNGGLRCDMALDVVMYSVGNLSIEASTLIFDPYKLAATGMPNKWCYVASHPSYDQEDFQDMNQVTRAAPRRLVLALGASGNHIGRIGMARKLGDPA